MRVFLSDVDGICQRERGEQHREFGAERSQGTFASGVGPPPSALESRLRLLTRWAGQLAAVALNDAEPHVDNSIRNLCGVKALDYGFGRKVPNAGGFDTDAGQRGV